MKTDLSKNSLVQVYVIWGLKYRIGEWLWIVERYANVVPSHRGYVLDYVIFCYVHDFYGWVVFHFAFCNNLYALLAGDDVPSWREEHNVGVSDALTFVLQKESYGGLSCDCVSSTLESNCAEVTNPPSLSEARGTLEMWKRLQLQKHHLPSYCFQNTERAQKG